MAGGTPTRKEVPLSGIYDWWNWFTSPDPAGDEKFFRENPGLRPQQAPVASQNVEMAPLMGEQIPAGYVKGKGGTLYPATIPASHGAGRRPYMPPKEDPFATNWGAAFLGEQGYPSVQASTPFGQMQQLDQGFFAGKGSPFDMSVSPIANPQAQNTAQRGDGASKQLQDAYDAVQKHISGAKSLGFDYSDKDSPMYGKQDLRAAGFKREEGRRYSTQRDAAGNIIGMEALSKPMEDITQEELAAKSWRPKGSESTLGNPFTPNLDKFIARQTPQKPVDMGQEAINRISERRAAGLLESNTPEQNRAILQARGTSGPGGRVISQPAQQAAPVDTMSPIEGASGGVHTPWNEAGFNKRWKQAESKMMDYYKKNPSAASADVASITKKKPDNSPNL
jgi:hypothetical protein